MTSRDPLSSLSGIAAAVIVAAIVIVVAGCVLALGVRLWTLIWP